MADNTPPELTGPPPATTVDGSKLAIFIVVGTLFLGIFTYYGVPRFVIPYFEAKPAQADEFLTRTTTAIAAYKSDFGAFPPMEELNHFRRHNKNLTRSRSYGIFTHRIASLTSPTAYLNPDLPGDPYAMPEQSCPAGYFVGEFDGKPIAVVYSAGPNLKYNIRPPDLRLITTRQGLLDYLATQTYDPTNGTRSGGDLWRLLE